MGNLFANFFPLFFVAKLKNTDSYGIEKQKNLVLIR